MTHTLLKWLLLPLVIAPWPLWAMPIIGLAYLGVWLVVDEWIEEA